MINGRRVELVRSGRTVGVISARILQRPQSKQVRSEMVGMNPITHNLEVWSKTVGTGCVELTLEDSFIPKPIDDEVVIEVHAAPINPFDLRLMIGPADPATAVAVGTRERLVTRLRIPDAPGRTVRSSSQFAHRLGAEGCGRVVDAGNAPAARALLGQSVAVWAGGGMYSRYCKVRASDCLPLPASTQAAEGRRRAHQSVDRSGDGRDDASRGIYRIAQ